MYRVEHMRLAQYQKNALMNSFNARPSETMIFTNALNTGRWQAGRQRGSQRARVRAFARLASSERRAASLNADNVGDRGRVRSGGRDDEAEEEGEGREGATEVISFQRRKHTHQLAR